MNGQTTKAFFYSALGGAVGASLRWGLSGLDRPEFPWGILLCNTLGVAALAIAYHRREQLSAELWHFHGVGFCGGLTTVSTWSAQLAGFLRASEWGRAAAYWGISLVLALPLAAALMFWLRPPEGELKGKGDK